MKRNKKVDTEQQDKEEKVLYLPIYMCIGISVGMAIGSALGNIPVSMCIGLAVGVGIGALMDAVTKKQDEAKKENLEDEKDD